MFAFPSSHWRCIIATAVIAPIISVQNNSNVTGIIREGKQFEGKPRHDTSGAVKSHCTMFLSKCANKLSALSLHQCKYHTQDNDMAVAKMPLHNYNDTAGMPADARLSNLLGVS